LGLSQALSPLAHLEALVTDSQFLDRTRFSAYSVVLPDDAYSFVLPDVKMSASYPTFPPAGPQTRRGTRYIRRDQIIGLYTAIMFANYQGSVLNAEVTVSWRLAGIVGSKPVTAAFNLFMDRYRKFMGHRKSPAHYYAVFENHSKIGYHSHMALHVPDKIRDAFHDWRRGVAADLVDGADPGNLFEVRVHKDDNVFSQWKWFQYCMKGLDPRLYRAEKEFGAKDLNSLAGVLRRETGFVEMQRVRISRSLGATARAKAQYAPPYYMTRADWKTRYSDAEYQRGVMDRHSAAVGLKSLSGFDYNY
jgi:hypothetical protein